MHRILFTVVVGILTLWSHGRGLAQQTLSDDLDQAPIEWLSGPFTARLQNMATVEIPEGYLFADAANARRYLEACQIRPVGTEVGLVRPYKQDTDWYIVFEFSGDGYVKDEEAENINADDAIRTLRQINEDENAERKRLGWQPTRILGWEKAPTYDPKTHNLEWALKVARDDVQDVNFNTRVLGRFGVMTVNLVVSPKELPDVLPVLDSMVASFDYDDGHRYAEFKSGDKVARYGLTALITGTVATAAIKTGLMRRLLAPIIAVLLAGFAGIKRRMGLGRTVTADVDENQGSPKKL